MNIAKLYRNIKQILNDTNIALTNRGLDAVNSLMEVPIEVEKLGNINRLHYLLGKEIIMVTEDDLRDVTEIKGYAFYKCNKLRVCFIPSNITKIGGYVFYACPNLEDVYVNSVVPPVLTSGTAFGGYTSLTIHVPIGSGDAYKAATNWSSHANKIIEDIIIE